MQIAELMAVRAKNRDLSYCKIVEVIAETNAPLSPMEELLAKIPSQRPYISSPMVLLSLYSTVQLKVHILDQNYLKKGTVET